MSPMYPKVKKHYESGKWSIAVVRLAVKQGWITAEEFKEITGEDY